MLCRVNTLIAVLCTLQGFDNCRINFAGQSKLAGRTSWFACSLFVLLVMLFLFQAVAGEQKLKHHTNKTSVIFKLLMNSSKFQGRSAFLAL